MRAGHKASLVLFLLITFALPTLSMGAETSLESVFNQGNKAFWSGDYKKARKAYKKLENLGVNSMELYFNRATTEARLKNLGRAIQYYEKVLRINPAHEDAIRNLALIRDFIARRASEAGRDADLAPAVGPWRAILDRFSPQSAAIAFLIFHLALFTTLIIRRFISAEMLRLSLGVLAGVLAILTISTFIVVGGKWHQETQVNEAVIVSKNTQEIMEGPNSSVKRFELEEGSRVRIVERKDKWVRIKDDQGRDGWSLKKTLGNI